MVGQSSSREENSAQPERESQLLRKSFGELFYWPWPKVDIVILGGHIAVLDIFYMTTMPKLEKLVLFHLKFRHLAF